MSDEIAHEAVVSSLMDLQARLRGDGPDEVAIQTVEPDQPRDLIRVPEAAPVFVNMPDASVTNSPPDLSVVEDDLTVEVIAGEDEPLRLLPDEHEGYFAPVTPLYPADDSTAESRLTALTDRLSRLEVELDGVIGRIQKVDPDRIQRLEAVHDELGVQHEGLKAKIDSHFTDLQHSIAQRLGDTEG